MRKILIHGLCVLVDVVWFLLAALLIGRLWLHGPSQNPKWHQVLVQGGNITYEDYWTTSPPPPLRIEKPWFECLNVTNED